MGRDFELVKELCWDGIRDPQYFLSISTPKLWIGAMMMVMSYGTTLNPLLIAIFLSFLSNVASVRLWCMAVARIM